MNRKDFHVGQTVYINNFSNGEKQGGLKAEKIKKIGIKYLTIGNNGYDERFSIETGLNNTGYDYHTKKLYLSPNDYYDRLDSKVIRKALIKSVQSATFFQLKAAAGILGVTYDPCERIFQVEVKE